MLVGAGRWEEKGEVFLLRFGGARGRSSRAEGHPWGQWRLQQHRVGQGLPEFLVSKQQVWLTRAGGGASGRAPAVGAVDASSFLIFG